MIHMTEAVRELDVKAKPNEVVLWMEHVEFLQRTQQVLFSNIVNKLDLVRLSAFDKWCLAVEPAHECSWENLKQFLESGGAFGRKPHYYTSQMFEIPQTNIVSFNRSFLCLATSGGLKKDDEGTLGLYYTLMPEDLRAILITHEPKTLSGMMDLVVNHVNGIRLAKGMRVTEPMEIDELSVNRVWTRGLADFASDGNKRKFPTRNKPRNSTFGMTDEEHAKRLADRICFRCGVQGHRSFECPSNPQREGNAQQEGNARRE
ncbi:hypothetical protein LPJ59_007074 [Coemansia sp. RSA 2399]|nr:hypothetical protein LPJ59_007074 [Coemansia sp. RSA 2399]